MSYVDTHGIRHYACMCEHDGQFRVEWCMASDGDHEDGIGPMWAPTAREALVVAQQSVQLMQQRVRAFEVYIESDDKDQLGRYIPLPMHAQPDLLDVAKHAYLAERIKGEEKNIQTAQALGWLAGGKGAVDRRRQKLAQMKNEFYTISQKIDGFKRYSTEVFVSTLVTNELSADHMLIVGWFTGYADLQLQHHMQQEVKKYAAQLREISI